MLKKSIITIVSGVLALVFTLYITLDTFVISHVYTVVDNNDTGTNYNTTNDSSESKKGTDQTGSGTQDKGNVISTTNSYSDNNITITLTTYRENNTDIYVADVVLSSPDYLKTAFAKSSYGKNVTDTTSNIAAQNNAILAINGDYYGVQEKGYVIKNGVLYRSTSKGDQQDLVICKDGTYEIINEKNITASALMEKGAYNLLSFGPGLLNNGQVTVSVHDEVDKAMASNPRTAIGIIDSFHYVFVVADGRTSSSTGLSLYQLANFMKGLGVKTGYNLDGGGSSTMYFNGQVINNPTSGNSSSKKSSSSNISERSVSDIVYIGY